MSIYSAAIIGVSPAGCVAAISLARKGFKVLLIDVSDFSGDLPLEGLLHRAAISSPSLIQRCPWLGYWTWRSLRKSLIAVAQVQGVEVWTACRVDAAIIEQGQLMGLTTQQGTVRAYHILDASGQRQWLSQQLGIPTKLSSSGLMARFKSVTWQMCDRFAGPGWFLLSDAAASPDPATAYGPLRAIAHGLKAVTSGLQAARAVADCEHGKILEALAAQRYSQWLQTWFSQGQAKQHSREYATGRSPIFPKCLALDNITPTENLRERLHPGFGVSVCDG